VLLAIVEDGEETVDPETLRLGLRLWVLPFADEALGLDAIKAGERGLRSVVLRLELDEQTECASCTTRRPSRVRPGRAHERRTGHPGCPPT
jgi:hypothetical protein